MAIDFDFLLDTLNQVSEGVILLNQTESEVIFANRPILDRIGQPVGQPLDSRFMSQDIPVLLDSITDIPAGTIFSLDPTLQEKTDYQHGKWYPGPSSELVRIHFYELTELDNSAKHHLQIINQVPDLVFRYRYPSAQFTFLNTITRQFFALPPEGDISSTLFDLISDPAEENRMRRIIESIKQSGSPYTEINLLTHANGTGHWIEWNNLPIYDEHGELSEIQTIGRDVSEHQATKDELRSTNHFLTHISDNLPAWISYVDRDLTVRFINAYYEHTFGLARQEIIGRHLREMQSRAEYKKGQKLYDRVFAGEIVQAIRSITVNGRKINTGQLTYIPDRNEYSGEVVGFFVLGIDISQMELLQEELFESSNRLRQITDNVPAYIGHVGSDLKYKFVNQAFLDIVRLSQNEVINHPIQLTIPSHLFQRIQPFIDAVLSGETVKFITPILVDASPKSFIAEITFIPEFFNDGSVKGFFFLGTDITTIIKAERNQKRLNQKLLDLNETLEQRVKERTDAQQKANQQLVASNTELERFSSILAHDLKEPMRGIYYYTKMLQEIDDPLSEEQVKLVQGIADQAAHASEMIDELRLFSRLAAEKTDMNEVDAQNVFESVIRHLAPFLDTHHGRIEQQEPLPTVRFNQAHLKTVFQNLITNGLKYNEEEQPTIWVGRIEQANDSILDGAPDVIRKQHKRFEILSFRDNGIGIRQRHLERIFEMFKRLHPDHKYGGGSGAGLSLVKKIIEKNHGAIWLNSVEGEGTTFYVAAQRPNETGLSSR